MKKQINHSLFCFYFRTVVAFVAEEKVVNRFAELLLEPHKIGVKTAHITAFVTGLGQMIMFCCYALHFWVGAKFIQDGIIENASDFLYVLMSILMAASSLGQVRKKKKRKN